MEVPAPTEMQSPININKSSAIVRNYTPFHFTGYSYEEGVSYPAEITYTPQAMSVQIFPNPLSLSPIIMPSVSGGGLYKEYLLSRLEVHWDSEHALDDKRYALETQLIHYSKGYGSYENALNYKDGIAVFSSFYQVGRNDVVFAGLLSYDEVEKIDRPVQLNNYLVPRDFLAKDLGKFYRYNGSLTSPCFNEAAIWTIFSKPDEISAEKKEDITSGWKKLLKTDTNFRPLQEQKERRVYLSAI